MRVVGTSPQRLIEREMAVVSLMSFWLLAVGLQGGLLVLGLILGSLFGLDWWQTSLWNLSGLGWGLLAMVPLAGVQWWFYRTDAAVARTHRELLDRALGEILRQMPWWQHGALALLAGVSEEILFRGALQLGLGQSMPVAAWLVVSIGFGLVHALTRWYFVFATVMGLVLGALAWTTMPANLSGPIVTHTLFDWIAFAMLSRDAQARALSWPESMTKSALTANVAQPNDIH